MSESGKTKPERSKTVRIALIVCTILYVLTYRYVGIASMVAIMSAASQPNPQQLSLMHSVLANTVAVLSLALPVSVFAAVIGGWIFFYYRRMTAVWILLAIPPALVLIGGTLLAALAGYI